MNGDTPHDRAVAAAAIVVGWLALLALFVVVGMIVVLCGPPVQ